MDDLNQLAEEKDMEKFKQIIEIESDSIMLILRAHLFSENLLERFITSKLSRGDKIIENGNFSYNQKLLLVDSFNSVPDTIISSLRNLNRLRNQCAHELDKKITDSDIAKLGNPLGKSFSEFKRVAKFDETVLLRLIISYICGYLTARCHISEHPELLTNSRDEIITPNIIVEDLN